MVYGCAALFCLLGSAAVGHVIDAFALLSLGTLLMSQVSLCPGLGGVRAPFCWLYFLQVSAPVQGAVLALLGVKLFATLSSFSSMVLSSALANIVFLGSSFFKGSFLSYWTFSFTPCVSFLAFGSFLGFPCCLEAHFFFTLCCLYLSCSGAPMDSSAPFLLCGRCGPSVFIWIYIPRYGGEEEAGLHLFL